MRVLFCNGYTIVKDYICEVRRHTREVFIPLHHAPGHAQADFGEALAVIGGVERKIHFLVVDLPHSDAIFVKAYPRETSEAFSDGHVAAFAFFGGVPQSILYDNTKLAVARILGDGTRKRTQMFSALQSHYLFKDRFGRPAKGNDKGKVEGMVGYARRNFMVPMPRFESFDALNAHLAAECLQRRSAVLRGHKQTIGERFAIKPETAEPAIGQIEVNLLAQTSLGPDGKAITDNQHSDHQFGSDRGPSDMAVISRQLSAHTAQVEKAIYLAQQVISRYLIFKAKVIKQPFRRCLCTHHQTILLANHSENGITISRRLHDRLNQQNPPESRHFGSLKTCSHSTISDRTRLSDACLPEMRVPSEAMRVDVEF